MSQVSAASLIAALGLKPHPEGGHYLETFRSETAVPTPNGSRPSSTAIYYLLADPDFSVLHRVHSDEVWHFYSGDPLELHLLTESGAYHIELLGPRVDLGQQPQVVVPAGVWQAAVPAGRFTFCGCTVAPGFDFADFELPSRAELLRKFPQHPDLVERLTRV